MKIGIQGFFLTKPYTGIGQYTLHLLEALLKSDEKNDYILVVPSEIDASFLRGHGNLEVKIIEPKKSGSIGMKQVWWEQIQVPKFFKQAKVDLVHFPYPANPWYPFKIPSIVTVHDTIPYDRKEYRPTLQSRLKHRQSKKALKRAKQIITVSAATENDLLKHLPSLKDKIIVIHNAPSPIFSKVIDQTKTDAILEKYNLTGRKYFIYVGGYDTRKNVRALANAYMQYVASKHEIDLVFVGDKAHLRTLYESLDYVAALEREGADLEGKVRLTGYLSEMELRALYSHAFALLNTSLKEGFNIPLVDAMAMHIPVLTSDIEVHQEIAGNYAIFCNPFDIDDMGEKMERLISDKAYYRRIKDKCEAYECPYSWGKAAKETLEAYSKLGA